jgi:hypothetical protein
MENLVFFSFNLGKTMEKYMRGNNYEKKKQMLINLANIFLKDRKEDTIFFISLQEVPGDSLFINMLKGLFVDLGYTVTHEKSGSATLGYEINGLFIYPNIFNNKFKITTNIINHDTRLGFTTKASIIFKITDSEKNLYITSSHLSSAQDAYETRKKEVFQIIDDISTKHDEKKDSKPYYLFIVGDLNFRQDERTDLTEPNVLDRDQITGPAKLLSDLQDKYTVNFFDLSQIDKDENLPTCKTIVGDEKLTCCDDKKCSKCYNKERIPSYCDRIIFNSNVIDNYLNPISYYLEYETKSLSAKDYEFIKASDHNPILSKIKLPTLRSSILRLLEISNKNPKSKLDYIQEKNKINRLFSFYK